MYHIPLSQSFQLILKIAEQNTRALQPSTVARTKLLPRLDGVQSPKTSGVRQAGTRSGGSKSESESESERERERERESNCEREFFQYELVGCFNYSAQEGA